MYRRTTPFVTTSAPTLYLAGNVRPRSNLLVDRIVTDRVNGRSHITTLSNPGRTRRVYHNKLSTTIVTDGSPRMKRAFGSLLLSATFHVCLSRSVANIRIYNTVGGIVTVIYNVSTNSNTNSGALTLVVAHNLTRVDHLIRTHNNRTVAYVNLTNVNSLVTAYASRRSHGHAFNCRFTRNISLSRCRTHARVIIRNTITTHDIDRLTHSLNMSVPLAFTIRRALCGNIALSETLRVLASHIPSRRFCKLAS